MDGIELLKFAGTLISSITLSVWAMFKWAKEREDAKKKEEEAREEKRREREEEREQTRREREEQKEHTHNAVHIALEQTLRKSMHDVANENAINSLKIAVLQEQGRFMKEQLETITKNLGEQSSMLMKIFQRVQVRD